MCAEQTPKTMNKNAHSHWLLSWNPQTNRTSGCVTTLVLGDSLWQENNNPQFLKIDKLVYSLAVNCLIAKLTKHKLKVTGSPTTRLCASTTGQGWINDFTFVRSHSNMRLQHLKVSRIFSDSWSVSWITLFKDISSENVGKNTKVVPILQSWREAEATQRHFVWQLSSKSIL